MTDVLDLRFGATLPTVVLPAVSAEKMKTMAALLSDSNPIHFDVDAVRALGMGERPVNQGPTNMAYIMNYLGEVFGSVNDVRKLSVRFVGNVCAGDVLEVSGTVDDVDVDLCTVTVELRIQGGPLALTGHASVARRAVA
ncbi:hypothetical protein CH274_16630 [Rhodococcus sp. 06-418-5]|uniref:MaoC family dehydratase n=1 Tax=Rhodococcus sp. 06-418-5 TaxID=2022507 RepID=UPI000B9A2505|nr:MaoC/PaaZ C-terminal domain-containing protein [Rhodococcus sp. 06-418-5]OZC79063.1 hypothetical protein CH274_16630 [Rhodococcus sp. 06-418-5]